MGITTAPTRVWPTTKQVNRIFVIPQSQGHVCHLAWVKGFSKYLCLGRNLHFQ